MADAAQLRNLLRKTDASAPAIQATAGAMMKHYDKSPGVAVVEWRNALHQARLDQHLPLLYVANETLQNSKRNRGAKFLEAFSPVLGQALGFICQKNPDIVEKVRRTVKIWGDRRVFSLRFVNELLQGLEPYRNGTGLASRTPVVAHVSLAGNESGGSFSPMHPTHQSSPPAPVVAKPVIIDIDKEMSLDNDTDDDEDNSVSGHSQSDDDLFGDSKDSLLKIELDLDRAANEANKAVASSDIGKRKRRRLSATEKGSSTGNASGKVKRRPTILSTNSLMELWNQVATLQQRFDNTQTLLAGISEDYLDESTMADQIEVLVGDELVDAYKKNITFEKRVADQRKELHSIAQTRRSLEQEAVRYLPWLEAALKQDKDDIDFCDKVIIQLKKFEPIHVLAKAAHEERLAEEALRQRQLEEQEKKKKEDEDRKKFMEIAMAKQTEAKPGMVWNKATGEYQYRDTDESWRD